MTYEEAIEAERTGAKLRNDGWHIWTSLRLTYVVSLKPINYCPMCG